MQYFLFQQLEFREIVFHSITILPILNNFKKYEIAIFHIFFSIFLIIENHTFLDIFEEKYEKVKIIFA